MNTISTLLTFSSYSYLSFSDWLSDHVVERCRFDFLSRLGVCCGNASPGTAAPDCGSRYCAACYVHKIRECEYIGGSGEAMYLAARRSEMRSPAVKRITVENYQSDKYYPRLVRAVDTILARRGFVSPTEVFVEMGLLSANAIEEWRLGRLPFLERAIQCNLSKASRILRLLRMHAHDLNLRPSVAVYIRKTRGGRLRLRFTKSGNLKLEEAYARHFIKVVSKRNRKSVVARNEETTCAA